MRNNLMLRLMGAFLLVIAIGSLVVSVLTSRATRSAFTLYTTRNGEAWAQRLALDLAGYYAQNGGWQGVDGLLQSGLETESMQGMMGNGMGGGQGHGQGLGRQNANAGMMTGMGQRLILADEKGIVISDSQNELVGRQFTASELDNGAAVTVQDVRVGTIIVTLNDLSTANTPAQEFLASVNKAIASSAVIAGVIALILGALLFTQIIAPLRQLKQAADAIASGDLEQRVAIKSHDEFGELGKTFNHMAESLASIETQRRHLVADVAHELRTPLAAIQGTLEGIQDGVLPLDEEQISALYSETMLLNRLVGDLKLLSLAEAGQLKLERQPTDMGAFIQQVVERDKPQADQKNIRLETDLAPDLPDIWIDADRITQVLNNLIGNAIRYTPAGGTITVGAAVLPQSGSLRISVTDSGPGIEASALPHVFDRFYRADKSRARASGGSGLGLAIVKQLVEAHGGSASAESPVHQGHGTRISFTLPGNSS